MRRKPQARRKPGTQSPRRSMPLARWIVAFPAVVAAVLCVPCLGLGYFWDDYFFLTLRGLGMGTYLLPDPHAAFYRPIPQGLYFLFLRTVDPANGWLGHVLNLAALAAAIVLLVALVSRLCGRRAGLISGLVFASMGCVPGLVAWISCSQDLFAIVLVLAALLLRDQGRDVAALGCATAAVLSKEPAIAAFPVLILWDRIVGRPASRPRFQIVAYASVTVAWALIHPGIHLLAARGFQSGATGYVGIEHPERWGRYLVRYVTTFVNLPPAGLTATWWDSRVSYGLLALVILVCGWLYAERGLASERPAKPRSLGRVAAIAALFGVPTLLMPVLLIRHWAPYFACIPAVGAAIFMGPLLSRQRAIVVVLFLAIFLLLGVRYRGIRASAEPVWTEGTFSEAASAVRFVRANFRTLFPSFPKGSQVVVSVESTGARGIQGTLIDGQALSVWYRDPTLRTVATLKRRSGAPSEFLVRVTTDLDVISIDPETHRVRATMAYAPDIMEINLPLVNYTRAVAAGGDTDRAVRIAESLARAESGKGVAFNRRLSASFLLAAGRREEAESVLVRTEAFPREDALSLVKRLLAEPTSSERLDLASFEAFGLSVDDPEAIRWIMRKFQSDGAMAQAAWFAQRLQALAPQDSESREVIAAAEGRGIKPERAPV